MSKKIFYFLFPISLFLSYPLYVSHKVSKEENPHLYRISKCLETIEYKDENIPSIEARGFLKLFGTHVINTTKVTGKFYSNKALVNMIFINGDSIIENSTIQGRAVIKGNLEIRNSNFMENLEITGKNAAIYSSDLNSIFIFSPENYEGALLLKLLDETVIKGSIIFKSGNGKIIMKNKSKIRGSIIGGKIMD